MSKKLMIIIIIIIALLAVGFGFYTHLSIQKSKDAALHSLTNTTLFSEPREMAAFSLTDNKNKIYTNQNLHGHWTMLFFGFTHCSSICPMTMSALMNMMQLLDAKKIQKPQVVFVTLDPERDTVAQLNTYVTAFNPDFIGLTGSETAIDALADSLSILHLKVSNSNNSKESTIDHSGTILLINPKGKVSAVFSMPYQSNAMAHDFAILEKYDS